MFEDTDEEAPVWTFEDRLAGDASQRASAPPAAEPRGVLDPEMADVLSAYSSEQGARVAHHVRARDHDAGWGAVSSCLAALAGAALHTAGVCIPVLTTPILRSSQMPDAWISDAVNEDDAVATSNYVDSDQTDHLSGTYWAAELTP